MAQAFINYMISNGDQQLQNQISQLRNKNQVDYSDCDENLLLQVADQMEQTYNENTRKRKLKPYEDIERKKLKSGTGFSCDFCDRNYESKKQLNRHLNRHLSTYKCDICGKSLSRNYILKKHKEKCKKLKGKKTSTNGVSTAKIIKPDLTCKHCGIPFTDYDNLFQHITANHPLNQSGGRIEVVSKQDLENNRKEKENDDKINRKRFTFRKTAINAAVNRVDISPYGDEKYDLLQFLANVRDDVDKELDMQRKKHRNIKWYVNARVEMVRDIDDGNQEKARPHFRSKSYISLANENNYHNLNEAFQSINRAMEQFINKGSNWILNKVIFLEVHTVAYSPISGSSYMMLPEKIRFTKGVVNIKNNDQKCFLWSVLAGLHSVPHHPERQSHYLKYEHDLNMKGIEYPVPISKAEMFEKLNDISVNVFGFEDGEVFPLYLTKLENGDREVDLLYITNDNGSHYCWIKSLDHFLGSMTRFCNRRFYCRRCLHGFTKRDMLTEHKTYCTKFNFQKVTYPKEGENDILEFKDFHKLSRVPFVIYADFECYAKKIDICHPNPEHTSTTQTTKFEACGYSYVVVCSNGKYTKSPVAYRGDNAVRHFLENVILEEEYIESKLQDSEPLIMSEETENQFQKSTNCYVCNRAFNAKLIKVRDHDHLGVNGDTESPHYSNFRGAACQRCNLNLQHPPFIPVYFHNLKNFDSHLLLTEAGKFKGRKLTCIPNNMEKYISFSSGKLRFVDSYQFMNSSLESLVDNLAKDGLKYFKLFRKAFPNDDVAKLLLQKNEYCYEYVDCAEKFDETQLPKKEGFYNSLTKEAISDEKYQHAQTVWKTFNMKNLGEFHDLYVLTDVLLLADVFEKFRDMTIENYKLDASHFFTSPGLAWQAALKMSGVCLDLITDPIMYNMIELGTRGGLSMITKKHSKANHKYLDDFDENQEQKHIMYFDANNLYGWGMSQPLPAGGLHFLSDDEVDKFDLQNIAHDSKDGYILEVDLEYPSNIHDRHNSYPLAPDHVLIEDEQLSPYSTKLWEKLNSKIDKVSSSKPSKENSKVKPRIKTKKLINTLNNRTNYVVHYRNLQLYAELGMKITKIHRILAFQQHPWLKSYIDFNANMRKHAKNEFEKDFFKLMCNR